MDTMAQVPAGSQEADPGEKLRVGVSVEGIVQGVGFRPFIFRLASRGELSGHILNDPRGVTIEIEGSLKRIERFLASLLAEAPPRARIDAIAVRFMDVLGEDGFSIEESRQDQERTTLVSPDIATCGDCLRELVSPDDRRRGYPFTNCTNCGPRYTIIADVPYDRKHTSMAAFRLCPDCGREYGDPGDRRFHAEPNACWVCGPRVVLRDQSGKPVPCADPIEAARSHLAQGRVVAIKGLGGFHLAVDATNGEAVALLRGRKQREEKPLAVMAPDLAAIRRFADVSAAEEDLVSSPGRPIVLLAKRPDSAIAEAVAPGNKYLGVMLPYTPIHHLLLRTGLPALVMTSGNLSEEPIAVDMTDALHRLGTIADFYLDHDREIVARCDDSVARIVRGKPTLLRRSRGWVPLPIRIATTPPVILACGGHLKNTVALTRRDQVFLSQHIGDLENLPAYEFFLSTVAHLKHLIRVEPVVAAHDLHPDYLSTRFALELGLGRTLGVQHHHAHIASCLGEAGLDGPVIGLALDGTGYGPDGTVWGGEILIADRKSYRRAGHIEQVVMPGGEAAIRHTWRMALSHLYSAYGDGVDDLPLEQLVGAERGEIEIVLAMIRKGVNSPVTSSCGRLFDAVACLAGLRNEVKYEGQGALELEMAAAVRADDAYPATTRAEGDSIVIPVRDLIREIVGEVLAASKKHGRDGGGPGEWGSAAAITGRVSAKFHRWLALSLVKAACALRDRHSIATVALSGGCWQNTILLEDTTRLLEDAGFAVVTNRMVPANDGGLSLGQVVVAAALLEAGS
jgi:hydrogenase maturation protein HypF